MSGREDDDMKVIREELGQRGGLWEKYDMQKVLTFVKYGVLAAVIGMVAWKAAPVVISVAARMMG